MLIDFKPKYIIKAKEDLIKRLQQVLNVEQKIIKNSSITKKFLSILKKVFFCSK